MFMAMPEIVSGSVLQLVAIARFMLAGLGIRPGLRNPSPLRPRHCRQMMTLLARSSISVAFGSAKVRTTGTGVAFPCRLKWPTPRASVHAADSCSSRHLAWSRSRQSFRLKLLVGRSPPGLRASAIRTGSSSFVIVGLVATRQDLNLLRHTTHPGAPPRCTVSSRFRIPALRPTHTQPGSVVKALHSSYLLYSFSHSLAVADERVLLRVIISRELLGTRVPHTDDVGLLTEQLVVQPCRQPC